MGWATFLKRFLTILIPGVILLSSSGALADEITGETKNVPWSGYWWPYNECGLGSGGSYYGSPSPLEKYEIHTQGEYPGESSEWYREQHCQETYPGWYGHCGHWALASLWENIEILPSVVDNLVFRVGDKKGLLTLLHNDEVATWEEGGEPDQFHYWLLKYVKETKQGFVVDMDKGDEVWQYPVYRFTMNTTRTGNTESVSVNVITADDGVDHDYIGTQNRYYTFEYDLYYNDEDEITGGEWTGDSLIEHPSKMWVTISQNTQVPGLDPDTVRAIAATKDDAFEDGETTVEVSPGFYNMILMDPDNYLLDADPGSRILINTALTEGGGYYIHVQLKDADQNVILSQDITFSDRTLEVDMVADNPPYVLSFYKDKDENQDVDDYETPGIYELTYDVFRQYSTTIPYVPKDGNWSGFAITNFGQDPLENVILSSYTDAGQPIETLLGPLDFEPGEKKRFLFSSLSYRKREYTSIDTLRISSLSDNGTVNLISGAKGGVAEINQTWHKGSSLVLPDTVEELQAKISMFGRVINESAASADVSLSVYQQSGTLVKTAEITLDPRASYDFSPGQSPFYTMPGNGWMEISSKNPDIILSGFQHIRENNGIEVSFALPADDQNKVVPHVPFEGAWDTHLVLINTGEETARMLIKRAMAGDDDPDTIEIQVAPKAKASLELQDLMDTTSVNPYYRSLISIASSQPFTGYYSYQSFEYKDHVTFPLLGDQDFSNILVLPHNTQGSGWWTGVGIFNPGSSSLVFQVKPYDSDGKLMENLVLDISLEPGKYTVFNSASVFEPYTTAVSFIRFETLNASDMIGGFYLFGHKNQGMCGANLKPVDP